MTHSIGIVERMRWMVGAAAAGVIALIATLAFVAATKVPVFTQSSFAGASAPASAGGITGAGGAGGAGSSAALDPRIASLAARQPASMVEAIVQFKATVPAARAQADATDIGGHVFATVQIIHGLAVKLTAGEARALAASPDVHAVSLNAQVTASALGGPEHLPLLRSLLGQLQTTYDETLGAPLLWRAGDTGAGVGVAVIDTGIDGQLPDFNSSSRGSRVVATAVTNPAAKTVFDTYGHGTDVAGIIAGDSRNRPASDPLRGRYVGIAPDANLIAIKASDEHGSASVLNVIDGIEFAIVHQHDYNIRVINLSLDSATPQSYKTDPLDAAVEAAWMHGIVVVAAAGNRGDAGNAVQFAPANDPYVITVGAVDENGTANPIGDAIAPWSSRGVTQDGFAKPDVYAPGAHIVSVLAPNSYFAHECPTCIIDGDYIRTSGTSMAAPMISGLVADLLQAHPALTPDQVKGALTAPRARSNPALQEVGAAQAAADVNPQPADQGLTPSKLLSAGGDVSYTMGSWSMGSWSTAQGSLSAPFAMGSWSCESCTGTTSSDDVQSSMGSWSVAQWSTLNQ
jgi:serine protease AprX